MLKDKIEYQEYLSTDYWKSVSAAVKERDGFTCRICNSTKSLEAHHRSYKNRGNEMEHLDDLTCLCRKCHGLFHGKPKLSSTKSTNKKSGKTKTEKRWERFLRRSSRATGIPVSDIEKYSRDQIMELRERVSKIRRDKLVAVRDRKKMAKEVLFSIVNPGAIAGSVEGCERPSKTICGAIAPNMPDVDRFQLTNELIKQCRVNNAFTNATLRALGVTRSSMKPGWPKRLIGTWIMRDKYIEAFEGRFIYKSGRLDP